MQTGTEHPPDIGGNKNNYATDHEQLEAGANHTPGVATEKIVTPEQAYILNACRALMMYGAPTHRLEAYMQSSAEILKLSLQSFYMPGCMIISMNGVHIVRCTQSLVLNKLYDVHAVYKDVIHKRVGVEEATSVIESIMAREDKFPRWVRVPIYGLASACIGPVSYGARPIDLPLIFILGSLVGFFELVIAQGSELYGYVFEMSSAILISFLGRALGSISLGHDHHFCFSAVAQASLVLILPGFTITTSALELQSKNIVSGAVRMLYGIIYTLFLAFGFTVGITIYGAIDSNATSATTCREPWPFWWQVTFVVPFTVFYILVNQGNWRKMPAMLIVTLAGWLVNYFSSLHLMTVRSLPPALGALTVGILANLYSRLGHGLAIALMYPAIFIQVPGSLAASGSLVSGTALANQLTHHTSKSVAAANATDVNDANTAILLSGYVMVEIAIGITAGLSISALLVYPFRKRSGKSGLFTL